MQRKEPRVLYFTASGQPTEEDIRKANLIGYNIGFRNASMVKSNETIEKADAVAGDAPNSYRRLYPHVETAIQLQDAVRRVAKGTWRAPALPGDTVDEVTVTEAELLKLSGEGGGEGDGDDFDEEAYLSDKEPDFKTGWFASKDAALTEFPADASEAFKLGWNEQREIAEPEPVAPVEGAAVTAPAPRRRRGKAVAVNVPAPPPTPPVWGNN